MDMDEIGFMASEDLTPGDLAMIDQNEIAIKNIITQMCIMDAHTMHKAALLESELPMSGAETPLLEAIGMYSHGQLRCIMQVAIRMLTIALVQQDQSGMGPYPGTLSDFVNGGSPRLPQEEGKDA